MIRILIPDKLAEEGLALLRKVDGVTFDSKPGIKPDELAATIGEYDGMIIRSGVTITREILAKPGRLRAIARAGVGVDNVDLEAATAAGVLVMNTPDANTLSTAEHTLALLLSLMRKVPDACAHVKSGGWSRNDYMGRQLAGRTLGIVGLGRVGRAVAERALAFGMKVVAHDPFQSGEMAMNGRVALVRDLDEMLPQVDALTLHAVMSADTQNLINAARLATMKKTAVILNCARGGLIDETALADALNNGRIAGAAVDVFSSEPPKDNPLLSARNVVLTPHLGASTQEAQTAVSTEAVESMIDYLVRGTIRNAVNVAGLPTSLSQRDRAWLDLAGRLGAILAPLCHEGVDRLTVTTHGGDELSSLAKTLALQALVEALNPHVSGRLNLVNAEATAAQRGIELRHVGQSSARDRSERVSVRMERGGKAHEVEGSVFADGRPRLLAIDGYRMELTPAGTMVMIFNDDRPGVIGLVGTLFGDRGINIADMALSRRGNTALMLLKLDGDMDVRTLEALRACASILSVRTVRLPAVVLGDMV